MKVRDLIAVLKAADPEAPVIMVIAGQASHVKEARREAPVTNEGFQESTLVLEGFTATADPAQQMPPGPGPGDE